MEYILNDKQEGCFLCDILGGDQDRENLVLGRGKSCAVVMNRYPYNNGHLLICPYRHVSGVDQMSQEERLEQMNLLDVATAILKSEIEPDGFNIGINLGRVAGAGLESHIHLHVVPRWSGDTNFMPVMADIKVIPQALLDLWDQLSAPFAAALARHLAPK